VTLRATRDLAPAGVEGLPGGTGECDGAPGREAIPRAKESPMSGASMGGPHFSAAIPTTSRHRPCLSTIRRPHVPNTLGGPIYQVARSCLLVTIDLLERGQGLVRAFDGGEHVVEAQIHQ